jgi:hypothetical protein
MIRNAPRDAAVFGVDLGKNIFHIVGLDMAVQSSRGSSSAARHYSPSSNGQHARSSVWRLVLDRNG